MIGDNIRYLRKAHNYSQAHLARRLEIKQASISNWESGKTTPDTKQLIRLSEIFSVPLDYFTQETPRRDLDGIRIKRNAIPIVGEIACGLPINHEQNVEGYADLPDGVRADFAIKCKGDSMSPLILDGDLVLIRQQPDVEEGQIAAVSIDGETTLKHVYHQPEGLLLVAENSKYKPIFAPFTPDGEIVIHGLAVGYTRLFA